MNIETNNKLIAEFMGGIYKKNPATLKNYDDRITINDVSYKFNSDGITKNYLQYYSSWDWLMPVVKKIINLSNDFVKKLKNEDFQKYTYLMQEIDNSMTNPIIEKVYEAVVEFIKWYGKNK